MAGPIREVPAVRRATEVLDVFLDGKGPRSVPEIIAELELPRSTAYELVQTLVARRYLRVVDGDGHRFDLGLRLFELGSAYVDQLDIADLGQQVARELSAQFDETVHVATLDGTDVVYFVKAESSHAVRMVSAVGKRLPAHCTAVGKVLLAGMGDVEVRRRYADVDEWVRMTQNTIAGVDELLAELQRVREEGLAFDDCESNVDIKCVAAPVRDASGQVVAGLSVSVPVHRAGHLAGAIAQSEMAQSVMDAAQTLSARLGHRHRASTGL